MPNGPIASGPAVTITVTFTPPNQIAASPDPAQFNWATNSGVQWRLTSTDRGATLQSVDFAGSNPQGPFSVIGQHPSDHKVWNAAECEHVEPTTYKYDITVKDGSGNNITLDPVVGIGNPPP